jgi:hypothetical protein
VVAFQTKINLQDLPVGLYLAQILSSAGQMLKRVLKE